MAHDFYESIVRPLLLSMTAGLATSFLVSRLMGQRVARSMESPGYRTAGPPVSAVIPALREEAYLPYLLRSLGNQTYTPIEAVVADSSPSPSRERTLAVCREYGAKYVYVPGLNVARARNEGAGAATGDILVFIDADCIPAPDYIERLVKALEDGAILAHGVDPNIGGGLHGPVSVVTRTFLKPMDYTTGRGVAIRKDAFREIGGYDEACDPMTGCREDLDLGQRVKNSYGLASIKLLQRAVIGTSPRREEVFGLHSDWRARGVRDSGVIS